MVRTHALLGGSGSVHNVWRSLVTLSAARPHLHDSMDGE